MSRLALALIVSGVLAAPFDPAVSWGAKLAEYSFASHGDSIRVHHYSPSIVGSTESLLLIPGWPATSADVLELGAALSSRGIHVFVLQPRGHGTSGGVASFKHALDDVDVAWNWLASDEGGGRFGLDSGKRALGGHSWGGGIALSYAAQHQSVTRIMSIAGSDHGVFIERVDSDPEYASALLGYLSSTRSPEGPVRFDLEGTFEELRKDRALYDLVTLAPKVCDRNILIVAGWNDQSVEMEYQVLPFYRALQSCEAASVRIVAFQDGHGFTKSRDELADEVYGWLKK